jgi:uncharacterized protein with HEPN domain
VTDDRLYLLHILDCLERIERYTVEGRDFFFAETRTQDAVVRNLQTRAESTRRLSSPLKERHPNIEWRDIAAFRNVVVHNYLGIDLNQIWDIVEDDLPFLKSRIEAILQELGEAP